MHQPGLAQLALQCSWPAVCCYAYWTASGEEDGLKIFLMGSIAILTEGHRQTGQGQVIATPKQVCQDHEVCSGLLNTSNLNQYFNNLRAEKEKLR